MAILHRIDLRLRGQLVHETLNHEGATSRTYTAPERGGYVHGLLAHIVDELIREVVRKVGSNFHRIRVKAVLECRWSEPRHNGRPHNAMLPRDGLAVGIEAGGDDVVVIRAIHVVLDVLLARPRDLHGCADLLADLQRLADEIGFQPAPEAAA